MKSQLSPRLAVRFLALLALTCGTLVGSWACKAEAPCAKLDETRPEWTACHLNQTLKSYNAQGLNATKAAAALVQETDIWLGDTRFEDYFTGDYTTIRGQLTADLNNAIYQVEKNFSSFTISDGPAHMANGKNLNFPYYVRGDVELTNGRGYPIYRLVQIEDHWYLYSLSFLAM